MVASGRDESAAGAGSLAELRARLRAATLRAEEAASDEALSDLTPAQPPPIEPREHARARVLPARG